MKKLVIFLGILLSLGTANRRHQNLAFEMGKMRYVILLSILLVTSTGCGQQETAFQAWKHYAESTSDNSWNAQYAANLIDRVLEKKDCVAFLWKKATGVNSGEAVAACSVLVVIVHAPSMNNSEYFRALAAEVQPTRLLKHMEAMDSSQLSQKWLKIHHDNLRNLRKDLEQENSLNAHTSRQGSIGSIQK